MARPWQRSGLQCLLHGWLLLRSAAESIPTTCLRMRRLSYLHVKDIMLLSHEQTWTLIRMRPFLVAFELRLPLSPLPPVPSSPRPLQPCPGFPVFRSSCGKFPKDVLRRAEQFEALGNEVTLGNWSEPARGNYTANGRKASAKLCEAANP